MATGLPGQNGINVQYPVLLAFRRGTGFAPIQLHLMVGKNAQVKRPNHKHVTTHRRVQVSKIVFMVQCEIVQCSFPSVPNYDHLTI